MNITDGDFEFIFTLYDEAQDFISDKDKPEWARKTILHIEDYGFDLNSAYKEISDHCQYLAEALDTHFAGEIDTEDEFNEYNSEDDEEMDY